MLTVMGLNRKKGMLKRLAEPTDPELNQILQEAVRQINRLAIARSPGTEPPQLGDKTGNRR